MSKQTQSEDSQPGQQGKRPRKPLKTSSVILYLAILFSAAFALLLLAYFMQQRSAEETIGNLTQSITSMESLDKLIEENRALREEMKAMDDAQDALQDAYDQLQEDYEQVLEQVTTTTAENDFWTLLWQVETLYLDKQYEECAECMMQMQTESSLTVPEEVFQRLDSIAAELAAMQLLPAEIDDNP